ncbi:hypothetical protein DFH06DRAFT_1428079, partial [Mycena polygramma]
RLERSLIFEKEVAHLREQVNARDRGDLLQRLPVAKQARHDSGRRAGPTKCFPGTRTNVLNDIKSWLAGTHRESRSQVYWLNGLAGIGKSTIAKTIAELAQEHGVLGGSFFFSRDDADLRRAALFFPTLAFQLAQNDQVFGDLIATVLKKTSDIADRSFAVQLQNLIIQPLASHTLHQSQYLLVIDALDECSPEDEADQILTLILGQISQVPFLRVLLTSRPERRIRGIFEDHNDHTTFILHDIEQDIVTQDIRLFVQDRLREIPRALKLQWTPEELMRWPPKDQMEALITQCGVLFVYAATSLRFIESDKILDPHRQLQIILGGKEATHTRPYAYLDELYLQVLRKFMPPGETDDDILTLFHQVVGTIVFLRVPLSIQVLSNLANLTTRQILQCLTHLHSVILAPEDASSDESARIYHPSFFDFITTPSRCYEPRFLVIREDQDKRLVVRCLNVMLDGLKRDMLELNNCSLLNKDIPDMPNLVKAHVPAHLKYACQYWVSHHRCRGVA